MKNDKKEILKKYIQELRSGFWDRDDAESYEELTEEEDELVDSLDNEFIDKTIKLFENGK